MRENKKHDVEETIQDIDDEISFKERRCSQAETAKDYRQCDEIISALKEKRRLLKQELELLKKKEVKAKWYKKKKQSSISACTSDDSDLQNQIEVLLTFHLPNCKINKWISVLALYLKMAPKLSYYHLLMENFQILALHLKVPTLSLSHNKIICITMS